MANKIMETLFIIAVIVALSAFIIAVSIAVVLLIVQAI